MKLAENSDVESSVAVKKKKQMLHAVGAPAAVLSGK
jgi:hypothetical protein